MSEKNITGPVEVGDEVRTLDRKRAMYGTVSLVVKRKGRKIAYFLGSQYPGGPQRNCLADVENLAITRKNTEKLWQT